MMKKRIVLLASFILCAMLLTGCQCEHEWTEANCTAARTCSKCDATEGNALGHTWAEASCAAPKTCTVCAATEGEALAHIWTDATYQTAAVCTVCGGEGEPLPSYFSENGLTVNAVTGQEADYTTNTYMMPELDTTGKLTASNFRIFESDNAHKASNGYEWRAVDFTATFSDGNSGQYGTNFTCCRADYYLDHQLKEAGDKPETFTVNFNGTEYDCVCTFENVGWTLTDSSNVFHVSCYAQVPAGYDGVVLAFYHSSIDISGMHLHQVEDDDMVIYRLA